MHCYFVFSENAMFFQGINLKKCNDLIRGRNNSVFAKEKKNLPWSQMNCNILKFKFISGNSLLLKVLHFKYIIFPNIKLMWIIPIYKNKCISSRSILTFYIQKP